MGRIVIWDDTTQRIRVRFPYDRQLVALVKSLPGSHFDWDVKEWTFPRDQAAIVVETLQPRRFAIDPTMDALLEEAAAGPGSPDDLTISQLQLAIGQALLQRFPSTIWVVGELANFDRNARKAWRSYYFDLVDRSGTGDVLATVNATLRASSLTTVLDQARAAGIELADGLGVRLRARVENNPARGEVRLVVDAIDPSYSVGELELRRERVLAALREDGLVEQNRALPVPTLPRRIALVTSRESDAYHDFLSTLRSAGYGFRVHVFDVRVQGKSLEPTVLVALEQIARHADAFDLCVIVRGGGSRVELGAWDNLPVGRAVATLPVKVLVGIGHDKDRCVLDDIADSAKTPTEAGERVVARWADGEARWAAARDRLTLLALRSLERSQRRLLTTGLRARDVVRFRLGAGRARVDRELPDRLRRATRDLVARRRAKLDAVTEHLGPRRLVRFFSPLERRLEALERRLSVGARGEVRAAGERVEALARVVRAVDPRRQLAMGYAIVRRDDGRVLPSTRDIAVGQRLTIEMRDGTLGATVDEQTPEPNDSGGSR